MRYIITIAILCVTFVVGCGGGGGDKPQTQPPPTIETEAGTLQVISYNCIPDLERMISEVNTTVRIARRQRPSSFNGQPLSGFEIHARTPQSSRARCNGDAACFERFGSRGRMHVWCDGGGVEHESAHALAWSIRLSCWERIYHNDIGFNCKRVR